MKIFYFRPRWEKPISISLRDGLNLHTIPPPGSGILVAFIINILDGYKFTNRSIDNEESTILTYHRIIEAFKYAFAARTKLGDPEFVKNINEVCLKNKKKKHLIDLNEQFLNILRQNTMVERRIFLPVGGCVRY